MGVRRRWKENMDAEHVDGYDNIQSYEVKKNECNEI